MINLMPNDMRADIVYARHNRVLLKWLGALVIAMLGIAAMTLFGQYYINHNATNLQSVAQVTQTRISDQNLQSTQTEIQNLSNNFTTISQLLKRQLLFSKMLVKIGSIVPDGAILSGITLSTGTSAIDLNIVATTREAATQAFVNISDTTNGLFNKADLISVACITPTATSSESASKYPCSAMIKVVIKTDSSFYFLNSISPSGVSQ
jgi:hypothetical protein